MKSEKKILEHLVFPENENPHELEEFYTVNQKDGLLELSSGSSRDPFDGFWSYIYQFRVVSSGSAETRLLEAKYTPNLGDEIKWDVLDGKVLKDDILQRAGKFSFGHERVDRLVADVEWHSESNEIFLTCIFHGDEEATKKIKASSLKKISLLELGLNRVKSALVKEFGGSLVFDECGRCKWGSLSDELSKKLSDWFDHTDPKDYGFVGGWDEYFGSSEQIKFLERLVTGKSIRLLSSDVWDSETLENELQRGVNLIFRVPEDNHGLIFLDGSYVETQFKMWAVEALKKQSVEDSEKIFEKYETFLRDVDSGLGHEGEITLDPRFCFPYYSRAAELEGPVGEYLQNRDWQNDYFDWVLIGAFIRMEEVSAKRELEPKMKSLGLIPKLLYGKKIELVKKALNSLTTLSQLVESRTYSVRDVLNKCQETRKDGGFVHPCAVALLENRLSFGKSVVILPEEARSPNQMEQQFLYRRKQKQSKAG